MPDARETRRLLFFDVLREIVRSFGGLVPLIYVHPLLFKFRFMGVEIALLGL
jgi:hypothetical protein